MGPGSIVEQRPQPQHGWLYNDSLDDVNPYDPARRELLKEAGQEDLRLTLTLPANYPLHMQAGELVAEQWKAIGIDVELRVVEWGTWLEGVPSVTMMFPLLV